MLEDKKEKVLSEEKLNRVAGGVVSSQINTVDQRLDQVKRDREWSIQDREWAQKAKESDHKMNLETSRETREWVKTTTQAATEVGELVGKFYNPAAGAAAEAAKAVSGDGKAE